MKRIALFAALLSPALAWAQEQPPLPPLPPQEEAQPLTPQEVQKMLQEIYDLMGDAEAQLNDAARGEALKSEADVVKRIEELLKETNAAAAGQKAILQKIQKLMGGSKQKQQGSIDKINELIKRAGT